MTKLVKEYLKETGNTDFVNIPINGGHLQYIHWLEDKIQALSLGGIVGRSEQLVCNNCGEGKPIICEKCYEIESRFRECY